MNRIILIISLCVFSLVAPAQEVARPRLVIGIVLDQMRWDYLYRFEHRFGDDGFKRLMYDGFNCQNTYVNYLPTFTAPGHACIYTGSVPALHGIAANDWMDLWQGKEMYCTEDKSVETIGGTKDGAQSPKNLLASTVTDELKLATRNGSKVFGVSIKDRGSILPAGHLADAAFWLESHSGNFITSSFYLSALPKWLQDFNKRQIVDSLLRLDWHLSFPLKTYTQSIPDENNFESKFKFEQSTSFPHLVGKDAVVNRGTIKTTPQGNTLTRIMAEALILGEHLGQRKGSTDFLAVSFSSTDYIGHAYGPDAVEIEDMYIKMDEELARFFAFLDDEIGKGNYLLFLTADHAAAHNPDFLKSQQLPAGRFSNKALKQEIKNLMAAKFDEKIILEVTNYQIYLNDSIIQNKQYDRKAIVETIKQFLKYKSGIAFVLDMKNIVQESIPEAIKQMAINGYHPMRSGDIQIITQPAWFSSSYPTGTTHGTWNPYDAHIPLLWYGWGIPIGQTYRHINMTDIAPTLSALLHIQEPNANIGKVITEILEH